jgi:hypothetical protein
MSTSSVLFAIRIDKQVKDFVSIMATSDGLTEALFVERLLREEARSRRLVPANDPGMAMMDLESEAALYLDGVRPIADEHVTRDLFAHIQGSPRLMALHGRAIRPPSSKIRAEKRRQYVHQRLGRFVKEYLGRRSLGEVLMPPGALIRSYTRLGR